MPQDLNDGSKLTSSTLIEHARNLRRGQGLVESSLGALAEVIDVDDTDPDFNWLIDRLLGAEGLQCAKDLLHCINSEEASIETPLNHRVLGYLEGHLEGQTLRQIAEALGVERPPVSSTLSMLQKVGKATRDEEGLWKCLGSNEGPLSVGGRIETEVLSAIRSFESFDEGFSAGDLGELLGRSGTSFASTLASLRSQGLIARLPSGLWSVCRDLFAERFPFITPLLQSEELKALLESPANGGSETEGGSS
jgi:DNA-binding transcriptional ArsR family regulator